MPSAQFDSSPVKSRSEERGITGDAFAGAAVDSVQGLFFGADATARLEVQLNPTMVLH